MTGDSSPLRGGFYRHDSNLGADNAHTLTQESHTHTHTERRKQPRHAVTSLGVITSVEMRTVWKNGAEHNGDCVGNRVNGVAV